MLFSVKVNSLTHSLTYSLTHSFTHSLTQSECYRTDDILTSLKHVKVLQQLTDEQFQRISDVVQLVKYQAGDAIFRKGILTHLLTHSLTYSLTHLLTHSLSHSLTHSLTHLLTHSLTHSLTH